MDVIKFVFQSIIQFIQVIAWPSVVILAFYLFKEQIRNAMMLLASRIEELSGKGWFTKFGNVGIDKKPGERPRTVPRKAKLNVSKKPLVAIDSKPATFFWFSNDLMWLQDILIRGASPEVVARGLHNSAEYARELGLPDTSFIITELSRLESKLGQIGQLDDRNRNSLVESIEYIKWSLSDHLEKLEPGFKKKRVFLKVQ